MKAQDIANFEELLEDAEDHAISVGEINFVQDTSERYDEYGEDTIVSKSQLEWLTALANRGN